MDRRLDLRPGTVVQNKYRIEDEIGLGGMARVVRATHLFLQQHVAIKVLLPNMVESESTVARFLREAQATVKLRSEHIARVQDVGTFDDGTPFMVMEFLDGNDLNQILRHHGPQTPTVVCDLLLQACEGIAEAHAHGIIHRDIKPSNFFLTRRPDGSMLLKILDFGISKAPVGYDDLTGTSTVIGTPTYMAPEQMKSGKSADQRSDIWSLGVVMYQLLNGRPPWVGENYADLILKVSGEPPAPMHVALPAGLGEIILRCLQKSPVLRYQDVSELARLIAPYASDPAAGAQAATRAGRILTTVRAARVGVPIGGSDLATPVPLSPAAMTPHNPSSASTSHGRGQVTVATGNRRGWLIAGGLSLVIVAGAGGWVASRALHTSSSSPEVAPVPAAAPAPAPPPPIAVPAAIVPPAVVAPVVVVPAELEPTIPKVKPEPKPKIATPKTPKPPPKTTTAKKRGDDDLFDRRK